VTAMIKLSLGLPVQVAPVPLSLDSWQPMGRPVIPGGPDA
jgi:hypothetical protein